MVEIFSWDTYRIEAEMMDIRGIRNSLSTMLAVCRIRMDRTVSVDNIGVAVEAGCAMERVDYPVAYNSVALVGVVLVRVVSRLAVDDTRRVGGK